MGGFAGASALGGFAQSFEVLVAARALQGVFGALLAPAALSLLTTTFVDPEERGKAFGIFGAVAVGGAAIGLILGGVLTEYLNWRWCLFVNLAFAVPAMLAGMSLLTNEVPEQRSRIDMPRHAHRHDRPVRDRLRPRERRDAQLGRPGDGRHARRRRRPARRLRRSSSAAPPNPLLPLRVVLDRDRGGSLLAMLLSGAGMFAVFLFLTYYLQQTLAFSPIESGLAFLPMTVAIVISAIERVDEAAAEDRPAAAHRRRHDDRRGRPADADEHRRRHRPTPATSCRGS